ALNNIILRKQARITYFFQNFKAKDHFVMTLYMIGRFFSALAARDRVKVALKKKNLSFFYFIYFSEKYVVFFYIM
ncbi:MAG: hypothetical protein ACK53Y_28105, partial [bacterium]